MKKAWVIEENQLDESSLLKNESIFNVANGYIGMRGNFEEGYPSGISTIKGNYINAFYEEVGITYGESACGFPETMQKLVNNIDAQQIVVMIGEECFSLFEGQLKGYSRWLDMKQGTYTRQIHWVSPKGEEVKIRITRLASFVTLELFAVHYEIERVNCDKEIAIISTTSGDVENYTNPNDPRVGADHKKLLEFVEARVERTYQQVVCKTKASNLKVAASIFHDTKGYQRQEHIQKDSKLISTYEYDGSCESIVLTKYSVYTDARRHDDVVGVGHKILEAVKEKSFDQIVAQQQEYLSTFWKTADVEIQGEPLLQQGLRFNVYQLLQSVGKDKFSNISAKGLSGEGYEGHYFWDTEIYILPFFILCNPVLAKQLLRYRYTILGAARNRAKELGHKKGAAYAWRTITGDECSAYFPAGTAQYHINGDIAYTYIQYYLATKDREFIAEFGAEVLFETARIWMEIGHFYQENFFIDAVTGPDEYTAIVNNNFYTNRLAQYHLSWAVKWYALLQREAPESLRTLVEKIDLTQEEIEGFALASERMYLAYHEELGIHEQDDTFLRKAVWDFENTPKEHYPLLLHYHPLTIYRYQVLKQADVVLSHFLLEDGVDPQVIKRSYDYYEKITTHDSSLSCAIYSVVASKIGYEEKAYHYFIETARLDLDNTHNNTKDGLHTANMGGTWMSVIYGFGGIRIKEDYISMDPRLPKKWKGLTFQFLYQSAKIRVEMERDQTVIEVDAKEAIVLCVKGIRYEVNGKETLTI